MADELDPFISRLVDRPEWLPTWTRHPWAALADAGDPAHRRGLARWAAVRERDDIAANAAVAVLLAECFDDERALLALAESVPRERLFEAVLPFGLVLTPGGRCARLLEKLLLSRLLHELSQGRLRLDLMQVITHLRIDDGGQAYLPTRRALIDAAADSLQETLIERFGDRLLIAAATATPDRPEVQQTVLSYWGEAEPLDAVPTAEPEGDEAPASWLATCALIGRVQRASVAERLIDLAHDTDFWRTEVTAGPAADDAAAYVDALARSAADGAEDRLLDIAKANLPVSSRAVTAIARRRARMAGVAPITRPRTDAVIDALITAGVLTGRPGALGAALIDEEAAASDSPLDLAALVLGVSGLAVTFDLDPGVGSLATHVTRSLRAIALASGLNASPFDIDDHESIGAGIEVRNRDTGAHALFTGTRMNAAAFDGLVPDTADARGRSLRRIRIDDRHVTYAMVDETAWSAYIDWAVSNPLPDTAPVPPRRHAAAATSGGLLGRLFGRG